MKALGTRARAQAIRTISAVSGTSGNRFQILPSVKVPLTLLKERRNRGAKMISCACTRKPVPAFQG
jgi:hypothetical protein